jgi:hypothetical protein
MRQIMRQIMGRIAWFRPLPLFPVIKTIALVGSLGLFSGCQSLPQSAFHLNDQSLAQGESLTEQERTKLERERVSIQSIVDAPQGAFTLENQTSTAFVLQGTITQVVPFLTGFAYELMDETGKIWIVSDKKNPNLLAVPDPSANLNTSVFWVIGTPRYEAISAGGQDWGETYLQEQSRFQAN